MGVISTAETAIIARLATQSITCKNHEPKMLVPPVATLWIASAEPGYLDDVEQGYGIGEVQWVLRYYQRIMQNEEAAYDAMRSGIEAIYVALGADRECGSGSGIRSQTLSDTDLYLATDGEQPLLVFEARLTAVLRPNIG